MDGGERSADMLTHLRVGIKSINSFETLVVAYLNVN